MSHRTLSSVALLVLAVGCARAAATETATTSGEHEEISSGGELTPCGDAQVYFAVGSAELDADARARLDRYAGCLSRHEMDIVYVAGMTDPEGTAEDNLELGRARAFEVAEYLHAAGCHADFMIESYGEEGSLDSAPLWPLERAAEVSAVVSPSE